MTTTALVKNTTQRPAITKFHASIVAAMVATSVAVVGFWPTNSASVPVEPQAPVADQATIADWAVENGLSGLSPASLSSLASQPSIADYANANGLSGLSPASLAPIRTDSNE